MRAIVALITLTIASLALIGCTDDECTLACPADQVCVVDSGLELCRDTCGGAVCSAGEACVDGACVADQSCSPACATGTHCVYGSCIEDYTSQNVCDPLRECRRDCEAGADSLALCLAACDADASATCLTCQDIRSDCEARESCPAGNIGPYTDCCDQPFCDCFPSHPACGNVLACAECVEDCGNDAACFNDCVAAEPACSTCLQPFFDCQENGGDCNALFCDCAPDDACGN